MGTSKAEQRVAVIVLGGASPDTSIADLLPVQRLVIAADSGYGHARALGIEVHALIGDLDSIAEVDALHAQQTGVRIHTAPTDKDQTDTELAIDWVIENGHDEIVIVYGGGDRLDHHLGALQALANPRLSDKQVSAFIGGARVHVLHGPINAEITCKADATVGLLPLAGPVRGITTNGLKWSLASEHLEAWSSRGVSNVTASGSFTVDIESGVLLIVIHEEES